MQNAQRNRNSYLCIKGCKGDITDQQVKPRVTDGRTYMAVIAHAAPMVHTQFYELLHGNYMTLSATLKTNRSKLHRSITHKLCLWNDAI